MIISKCIALDWPQYGYRRVTAELHRQGVEANHKRVLRLTLQRTVFAVDLIAPLEQPVDIVEAPAPGVDPQHRARRQGWR